MFKTIDRPANYCEIRSVIKFVKFIVRYVKVNPDLAPSDFHLFSHLKKFLAGQQFASDDEIKVNVQNWFRLQTAEFYEAVPRYDTCLNSHGEYVEK
ncbi:hypothetical protein AVEN_192044-1 [Araneus ventricosus]|uniref:Uncharacterized protein n=1 Tax=Araneus ventricosus TaxID=182803 RepID=A0A4Y2B788_ARAVE|nr:hypothetical protein AVEN_192044-1 [Araneus ventricosus]